MRRTRLLYLANDARYFLSHRLPVAQAAADQGAEIHVAAPPHAKARARIEEHGFAFHPIPMSRRKLGISELHTFLEILRVFRRVRPHLVHAVTIKPVIYGGIAARLTPGTGFVATISGLGHVFLAQGVVATLRKRAALLAYRIALGGKNTRVIFQNEDDRRYFLENSVVKHDRTTLIRGSGVDVETFRYSEELPAEVPLVVMASRMLRTKGVEEFAAASQILKNQGVSARFVLVGPTDPGNPDTLSEEELRRLTTDYPVEWWGERSDIKEIFTSSALVCLPSHGEGLPKVLLEAGAIGRAVVATDVPGCREVIREGKNGLLVPKGDARRLAEAIARLLQDDDLRHRLGANARSIVENSFSTKIVSELTLEIYRNVASSLDVELLPLGPVTKDKHIGSPSLRQKRAS